MRVKGYLSRRANGLYLLTYHRPSIAEVGNTGKKDVYPVPGDPLAVNNLCEWSAKHIWDVKDLPILESVRVLTSGKRYER